MRALPLSVLALLFAVGCESTSGPQAVQIQTQSATYQLGSAVTFTLVNGTSAEVFVARCCDVATALDRWQDSRWVSYSSGMCLATCPMDAISVAPHGSYGGTAAVADTGRYRLHLGVASSRGAQVDWSPTSNSFEVR